MDIESPVCSAEKNIGLFCFAKTSSSWTSISRWPASSLKSNRLTYENIYEKKTFPVITLQPTVKQEGWQTQNIAPFFHTKASAASSWAKGEFAREASAVSQWVCQGVSPAPHPWFIPGPVCLHSVNQKTGTRAPAHLRSLIILSPKRALWGLIFL